MRRSDSQTTACGDATAALRKASRAAGKLAAPPAERSADGELPLQSASTAALQNASGEPAGGRGGIGEPPPPAADDGEDADDRHATGEAPAETGAGAGAAQQGEDHEPSCVSTVTEVTRCGAPSAGGGGGSAERAAAALAARPPCGEAATFSAAVVASSAGVAAPSSRNADSILAAGPALERPSSARPAITASRSARRMPALVGRPGRLYAASRFA